MVLFFFKSDDGKPSAVPYIPESCRAVRDSVYTAEYLLPELPTERACKNALLRVDLDGFSRYRDCLLLDRT